MGVSDSASYGIIGAFGRKVFDWSESAELRYAWSAFLDMCESQV